MMRCVGFMLSSCYHHLVSFDMHIVMLSTRSCEFGMLFILWVRHAIHLVSFDMHIIIMLSSSCEFWHAHHHHAIIILWVLTCTSSSCYHHLVSSACHFHLVSYTYKSTFHHHAIILRLVWIRLQGDMQLLNVKLCCLEECCDQATLKI